ncbi:MAG: energy-coupling factor transporter ATPase [Anaerolineales bacterium]
MTVKLRNVSFTYWQSDRPALQDVSLDISAGEFVVITGPTGAGKSTFLQLLNGLIPHQIPGNLTGEVLIKGRSTKAASVAELSREVGMVFEDPDTQIVSLTVEDDVAFGPSNLGLRPEEIRASVRQALQYTRLLGFEDRNPFTLSGGEMQSLAMAGTLAMRPEILALDEPTSMLDPLGRARIISILKSLAAETRSTILVVEQNPELVIDLADRVLLFDEGRVIKNGTPEQVFGDVGTLLQVGVKLPPTMEVFWELRQRGLWEQALPLTFQEAAEALRWKLHPNGASPEIRVPPTPPKEDTIVKVQRLEHVYGDGLAALKSIDVQFERGEFTAIVGQNGSGKSTLAHHLVGILQPTNREGRVLVDGLDVRNTPLRELIRHVNYVFQNPDDQLFQESVREEIEYGLKNLGIGEEERKRRLESVLARFGLQDDVEAPPKSLRRGLRTKIAIASLVAMQPAVLVVDEPTTGLDRLESLEIMRVLEELVDSGTTVIFITHEMDLVAQFARRVVVMHAGNVLIEGPPTKVFSELPILEEASLSPPDIYRLAALLGWSHLPPLRTPADLADLIARAM